MDKSWRIKKHSGQSKTELLIIVALIAISCTLVAILSGTNIRKQYGKTSRAVGGHKTFFVGKTDEETKDVWKHRYLADFSEEESEEGVSQNSSSSGQANSPSDWEQLASVSSSEEERSDLMSADPSQQQEEQPSPEDSSEKEGAVILAPLEEKKESLEERDSSAEVK